MSKLNPAALYVAIATAMALSPYVVCAEPIIKFVETVPASARAPIAGSRAKSNDWRGPQPAIVVDYEFNQDAAMNKSRGEQHALIRFLQPIVVPPQTLPADEPTRLPVDLANESADEKTSEEIPDHEFKPIGALTVNVQPSDGPLPDDVAALRFKQAGHTFHDTGFSRPWGANCYAWVAPANAHRPLYFEDENLERYGYHWGPLQPAVSAAHFFSRIPAIPYMRGAWSPRETIYSLGYYRPGSSAPFYVTRPPVSLKGAALEAAAVGGGILLVP